MNDDGKLRVVLATHNAGKIRELAEPMADFGIEVVGLSLFPEIGEIEETGTTFEENALIKARAVCAATGLAAVADDSGLEVDALDKGPGVYSARYSNDWESLPGESVDQRNMRKLLFELRDVPQARRSCRFVSCMVAVHPDGRELVVRGTWEGRILEEPLGENGFGYDPLFWDESIRKSAAQLTRDEKNARSHRGNALRALLARWCLEERIEFLYASGAHAPASAAWVAARMLQIPFAFAVRTADLASPAKDWLVKAEQAAFVRCDTEATRKAVCELLPSVDPRRIVLLRDALTLTPPDEDVSMPPSNVPEPLQLLAVGTMTSRKGYDTLLQACLALQKAGVDFRLTLVGTGPWRLRLRLLSWRLGLRKLVSFPGQLPHEAMTDLYRRTDIFIAPGHMTRGGDMDGLPSALTEAMAFGVAVVVSDLPGQLEVVQNGRSGIVVPQNDVTALSQALLDLAGSAEKRRHLGAEAWKRIREVLDEEATEARLTSLFKAACRR